MMAVILRSFSDRLRSAPSRLSFLFFCLIKLLTRCLSFLASLWLRAVVVGGGGRVGCPALVAHYGLRAHHVSTELYGWSALGGCLLSVKPRFRGLSAGADLTQLRI
jgi:hypothetical protein